MKLNPEQTREYLKSRQPMLRDAMRVEPTNQMVADYQESLGEIISVSHKTDRGIIEISRLLGMKLPELKQMLIGKTVLDIGCGEGKLTEAIAKLPGTEVVALDTDPEVLDKVANMPNITIVEGSGIELPTEVTDLGEADVVISSFSSIHWAESPQERIRAIEASIGACATNGTAFLIPIMSNPRYRDLVANSVIQTGAMPGERIKLSPIDTQYILRGMYVSGWMELQAYDYLDSLEESGRAEVSYRSSSENSRKSLIEEHYSAIVTKLS